MSGWATVGRAPAGGDGLLPGPVRFDTAAEEPAGATRRLAAAQPCPCWALHGGFMRGEDIRPPVAAASGAGTAATVTVSLRHGTALAPQGRRGEWSTVLYRLHGHPRGPCSGAASGQGSCTSLGAVNRRAQVRTCRARSRGATVTACARGLSKVVPPGRRTPSQTVVSGHALR